MIGLLIVLYCVCVIFTASLGVCYFLFPIPDEDTKKRLGAILFLLSPLAPLIILYYAVKLVTSMWRFIWSRPGE